MSTHSPLESAVESLLRSIPERWGELNHDKLTSTEQRALFLLVAAGLVERRFGVRLEMAGQTEAVVATFSATGEYGLVEALDPLLAEVWTKWGTAFKNWKSDKAAVASPFRVTRSGDDEWRLTEHGVMARADLDVEAPSDGAEAFAHCRQWTLEFILRTGRQQDRPPVRGAGHLIQLKPVGNDVEGDQPASSGHTQPLPVALANADETALTFRDALVSGLQEAFQSQSTEKVKKPGAGIPNDEVIRKAEKHVRDHKGVFPGRNKLAKIVGCAPSSITKAIKRSTYLKARKAENEAAKRSGHEVRIKKPLDEFAAQPEFDKERRDEALDKLITEQGVDQRRDERQRQASVKRPRRED